MGFVRIILLLMIVLNKTDFIGCEKGYAKEYEKWKSEAWEKYQSNITAAEWQIHVNNKDLTGDRKYAAYVTNIYTQNCLYSELNAGLRQNTLTSTMQLFANLMHKIFNIFSKCRNTLHVYRGENRCSDKNLRGKVTNKGFTGASESPRIAYDFMFSECQKTDCQSNKHYRIFMKIYISDGLPIYDYSVYPDEKEILLINGTQLEFTKKVTDESEILHSMRGLGLKDKEIKKVDIYVEASQTGLRQKRSTVTCGSSSTGCNAYKQIILFVIVYVHGHYLKTI